MDKAKVPAGGAQTWEVPDLDEGILAAKSIDGIILHWMNPRAYWQTGMDEGDGNSPPDCSSNNGEEGFGDPGGDCLSCPLNQWGSAAKGEGKACKEKRLLFLLTPDAYMPLLIQVPTMSIKPLDQYFFRLASKNLRPFFVVTSLTLEKAQQKGGGNYYSRILPKMTRRLSLKEVEAVKGLVGKFQPTMPQPRNQRLNE